MMTRLTVILRGAPARRDTTAVGGRRKKDMIDLENLIGVGPSEKRLRVNHATLLTDLVRSDYQRVLRIYLLVHLLHRGRWHLEMHLEVNLNFLPAEVVETGRVSVIMADMCSRPPQAAA